MNYSVEQCGQFGDGQGSANDGKGTLINGVQGTIDALYDPMTTKKGKILQNLFLRGDQGGKIKVTLHDRSPLSKEWQGQSILISAKQSQQFGPSGVKIRDNSYQSREGATKNERLLWITGSAEITLMSAAAAPQPPQAAAPPQAPQAAAPPQAPQAAPAQMPPQAQPSSGGRNEQGPENKKARVMASKLAWVWLQCLKAADYHLKSIPDDFGVVMGSDDLRQIATSIFIDVRREINIKSIDPYEGNAPQRTPQPQATQPAPPRAVTPPPAQVPPPVPPSMLPDNDDEIPF